MMSTSADIANSPKSMGHQLEKTTTAVSISSDQGNKKVDDFAQAAELQSQWVEGTIAERRLVRKLDWRILPCCWTLYLLGFLDRANIGYAAERVLRHNFD